MTKKEKAYIIAREEALRTAFEKTCALYGPVSEETCCTCAAWEEVRKLCRHFFPEYRLNETLDG